MKQPFVGINKSDLMLLNVKDVFSGEGDGWMHSMGSDVSVCKKQGEEGLLCL